MGGNCFFFFVPLHTANFLLMDDNKKKTKKKLSTAMLGRAFVELDYRYRTVRGYRLYQVVRRQPDEMRALRQQMATDDTDTDDTDVF